MGAVQADVKGRMVPAPSVTYKLKKLLAPAVLAGRPTNSVTDRMVPVVAMPGILVVNAPTLSGAKFVDRTFCRVQLLVASPATVPDPGHVAPTDAVAHAYAFARVR